MSNEQLQCMQLALHWPPALRCWKRTTGNQRSLYMITRSETETKLDRSVAYAEAVVTHSLKVHARPSQAVVTCHLTVKGRTVHI